MCPASKYENFRWKRRRSAARHPMRRRRPKQFNSVGFADGIDQTAADLRPSCSESVCSTREDFSPGGAVADEGKNTAAALPMRQLARGPCLRIALVAFLSGLRVRPTAADSRRVTVFRSLPTQRLRRLQYHHGLSYQERTRVSPVGIPPLRRAHPSIARERVATRADKRQAVSSVLMIAYSVFPAKWARFAEHQVLRRLRNFCGRNRQNKGSGRRNRR